MNTDTQFPMTLISCICNGRTIAQTLRWDTHEFKGRFDVQDLCEYPSYAIIGRDLFDANDYIQAVKFGMALAAQGYTDIALSCKEREFRGW